MAWSSGPPGARQGEEQWRGALAGRPYLVPLRHIRHHIGYMIVWLVLFVFSVTGHRQSDVEQAQIFYHGLELIDVEVDGYDSHIRFAQGIPSNHRSRSACDEQSHEVQEEVARALRPA